ncbi:LLM class flavin-dependent oxidoreductase [Nioella nitratireducens]|mgnify:CR=1 FL=1|uniref:LLM class flavin-dependent oxidoreductase n=1 Tax=Nioella nitratireducens TaxID=1287720 RepID=UPI000A069496
MQIGIYTFAESGAGSGADQDRGISPSQRLRNLVEEIVLADQVGLDWFGVGEHHRPDYAVSNPAMSLAAAATQTKNIRLSSAVTVLSSDDPIRVFQQFSMLDNLTQGRAEIMVGRGAFIESFPLFGLPLDNYDGCRVALKSEARGSGQNMGVTRRVFGLRRLAGHREPRPL